MKDNFYFALDRINLPNGIMVVVVVVVVASGVQDPTQLPYPAFV